MAYNFIDKENEITKLLPAYIFNYSYDNGKGLFLFIKYLTNYIETANEALDTICSELNVNSKNTYILDILAKKLGVEIPTTITSKEDKRTVLKGKIMTLSSTGCAQAIIDTIYGLYPDWEKYNIKGTPIEVDDKLGQLFYNTKENPTLEGLGWDNADETTNVFGTVTKILNVLVSTTGPVVQLVRKEYDNLIGYSVIVHYTTESDNVNVISYKDENTCDIETHITPVSSEIDEVKSFIANQKTFYSKPKYNTYNYDAEDMYYNSYRTIEYTNNWENYTWQNLPNNISRSDIWQDNDGNIYATREIFQYKLNKQTLTWEDIEFIWKDNNDNIINWGSYTPFYRGGIWTDGKKMYYSYRNLRTLEPLNYELENNYTWKPKTWYGLDTLPEGGYLDGAEIWTDNNNIYCSGKFNDQSYEYILNPNTSTWSAQTWEGITNIQTGKLFHYKEQVLYCVYYDSATQNFTTDYYTLNIGTNKWTKHNWPDGIYIDPLDIWSDGNDYYCSSQDPFIDNLIDHYKLNQTSFTWEPITWTGLEDISIPGGRSIWHFDNNVFYGFTKRLTTVNSDKVIVDRKRLDNNYQKVFSIQSKSYGDFIPKTFFADDNIQQAPLQSNTIKGIDVWRNIKNNRLYYNDPTNSRYYYKQTSAWLDKTWNTPNNVKLLYGRDIYTIDDNTYYTYSENDTATPISLQLTSDNTWINKGWVLNSVKMGRKVWRTSNNSYYDSTDIFFKDITEFNKIDWVVPAGKGFGGDGIWSYKNEIYYNGSGSSLHLTKDSNGNYTNVWENKQWNVQISGKYIWTDGTNVYYSEGTKQYKLNDSTLTWTEQPWTGLTDFSGSYIWTDGTDIYFSEASRQYKLVGTDWIQQTWIGLGELYGNGIWKYNDSIYYSRAKSQYKLTKNTINWSSISWGNLDSFQGYDIWYFNDKVYCSYKVTNTSRYAHYVLDTSTTDVKWKRKYWVNYNSFDGEDIWTDGNNVFAGGYRLNGNEVASVKSITWSNIPDNFDPINIWHIGDTTYYSNGTIHKIINEDTTSFDNFTEWKGLSNFDGKDIWKDIDGNIFYKDTYILETKTKTWLPKYWNLIDNKKSSEVIKSEYIWSDIKSTYINNDYILNSYIDTCTQNCKFDNKQLSVESKLTREYATYPINPVRLQAPSYALDMIKLPVELSGWHSPDGIKSPVTIINNVTDNVPKIFEIISEKYQNEWGRYISKDGKFNPIIKNAVSVIDEGSLLQGAKNMHYKVIIDVPERDEEGKPELTKEEKTIITKYLIPKFLGVGYEVEFKQ